MKKKRLITLIITAVLVLTAIFVVLYENDVFSNPETKGVSSEIFAVKDTSEITKIFMADKYGNIVTLKRLSGGWTVNDSLQGMNIMIEALLKVMKNLRVKNAVANSATSAVNGIIATEGIKVEIYAKRPLFKLFSLKFGEKEKLIKTYFMGPSTQDNMANFAYLEGMKEPHVVYIPGFRGYLTPQFNPDPYVWITHQIFATKITRIDTLKVVDFMNPEESFKIVKVGSRSFALFDGSGIPVVHYDTTKLLDMLSEYRNLNFEDIVLEIDPEIKQHIFVDNLWKEITLINTDGEKTTLTGYKKDFTGTLDFIPYSNVTDQYKTSKWDIDRFFAVINHNTSNLYTIQYYHFERQVQPLSYYRR
ncbi:MAG: DUF4340 domain-containing protein [Bacteroidales bacterium]|jgi:hypothetical protein|nr:DUF4340 domain-containing protein [Bacteroidales bacterium]